MLRWYNTVRVKSKRIRPRWVLFVTILAGMTILWLASPVPVSVTVDAPEEVSSKFEFGDTRTVGQSFIGVRKMQSIDIPIALNSRAQGPLILHIRETYLGPDLRTSTLFNPSSALQHFEFPTLTGYSGKKLIWVLENPNDPDQTATIFREIDGSIYADGQAYTKNIELPGDFKFTLTGQQTTFRGLLSAFQRSDQELISETSKKAILSGLLALVMWVLVGNFVIMAWGWLKLNPGLFLAIVLLSTSALHVVTARTVPVNNDEGAYLQDAFQVQFGFVPVQDYLTKGPVYIYMLALWVKVVPTIVPILRHLSTLLWCAEIALIYLLLGRWGATQSTRYIAAILLALSPGAVILSTALLLQSLSVVLVLSAFILLTISGQRKNVWYTLWAVLLFVLAYLTRASSAPAVLMGVGILFWQVPKSLRGRFIGFYIVSGVVLGGLVLAVLSLFWGFDIAAVAFNLEALTVSQARGGIEQQAQELPLRWALQSANVLWTMAPWLILGGSGLFWYIMRWVPDRLTKPFIAIWFLLTALTAYHIRDMSYFVGSSQIVIRAIILTVIFLPVTVGVAQLLVHRVIVLTRAYKWIAWITAIWFFLLAALYYSWGDFRNNYLLEFLPPLVILTSVWIIQVQQLWANIGAFSKRFASSIIAGLFIASWISSWELGLAFPPNGTMDIGALREISVAIDREVPFDEPIFTAQSTITALAHRPIMFNYSHSGWYLYERQGLVPSELLIRFFKPPNEITDYLADEVRYVVTDRRTQQVYFADYPERQKILDTNFEEIASVDNRDGAFKLYRRIKN